MSNQSRPTKTPLPVHMAHAAIEALRTENPDLDEKVVRALPGYAVRLERAGKPVSIESLAAVARKGLDEIKIETEKLEKPQPAEKDFATRYQETLKRFDYFHSSIPLQERFYNACIDGDLQKARTYHTQGAKVKHNRSFAFICATQSGNLELMKWLVDQGANPRAQNNDAIRMAIKMNNHEAVTFLRTQGLRPGRRNMMTAAAYGHIEMMKRFHAEGVPYQIADMCVAAQTGKTDVIKFLIEQGINPRRGMDAPIAHALIGDKVESVNCLRENMNWGKEKDDEILIAAAKVNAPAVVKYMIEETDISLRSNYIVQMALEIALETTNYAIAQYLAPNANLSEEKRKEIVLRIAKSPGLDAVAAQLTYDLIHNNGGIDITGDMAVTPDNLKKLYELAEMSVLWTKIARQEPPEGLEDVHPKYFRPKLYKSLLEIYQKEGFKGAEANRMAFYTAALFQSEERVLQYIEKWNPRTYTPLHDLTQMIRFPNDAAPDLAAWGDAALKCGPAIAKLTRFSDKLPVPVKSADGKTWSAQRTKEACAAFPFKRADENKELASLCFEYGIEESMFEDLLSVVKISPTEFKKQIPDIEIKGEKFGLPGAVFKQLTAGDPRGLFLGEIVGNCQSVNGNGQACALDGFLSEKSGFYVIEDAKGKIIAESWAWRGEKGELCLDSLETLGRRVMPAQWHKLLREMAHELTEKKDLHDVTALTVGTRGDTPKARLSGKFKHAAEPAVYPHYTGYTDAKKQYLVWQRKVG